MDYEDNKRQLGTIRGSKVDHTGPLKTKREHGDNTGPLGGSYGSLKDPWF